MRQDKDEIVNALAQIRLQRAQHVILAVGAALLGLVISINYRDHLIPVAASGLALLVAFVAVARFRELAALQPLLADLPRTAERITWRDRLAAASAATSLTNLMLLGFAFAAFGLVSAFQLVGLVGQAQRSRILGEARCQRDGGGLFHQFCSIALRHGLC
jgi:hypothetical protein